MIPTASSRPARLLLPLLALALAGITLWLRAPSFGFKTWNVDEAIHAAVATRLLDGGVMYRDAVDQRTPLTYVAMAGIFLAAGPNNLWAVHAATALLIAGTAFLLFLCLRKSAGSSTAVWSALLYPVLATGLFYQGDANAFVTEWFVTFFSTAAAWCFWSMQGEIDSRRLAIVGALAGLAFLSKQPGALDLAAPALTVICLVHGRTGKWPLRLAAHWCALALGFFAPIGIVTAYYYARGALGDAMFYTWTYNLRFYGPEIGWAERFASAGVPWRLLAEFSPWLAGVAVAALAGGLYWVVQRRPTPAEARQNPIRLYLLIWAAAGIAGAASGGRGFDHYSIQLLPPLCAGLGWILGSLQTAALRITTPSRWRALAVALLAAVCFTSAQSTLRARLRTLPVDPSFRAAQFIRSHTEIHDAIFVWGYHPDIYLFSQRKPASRFVYASFLSGLVPWTNTAPERDTAYAVVPDAIEQLLADLEKTRPAFIVDCSAGPNRYWDKYPLAKFPVLDRYVRTQYASVETDQFTAQGFRLFMRQSAQTSHTPIATTGQSQPGNVAIFSPRMLDPLTSTIRVSGHDPALRAQRIELWTDDGTFLGAVRMPTGSAGVTVDFPLPESLPPALHRLEARLVCSDGTTFTSTQHEIDTRMTSLPAATLAAFSLPEIDRTLAPSAGSAPFGASVAEEDGRRMFFTHAPAQLQYPLPDNAVVLRGCFGFRPGAYGADNPAPTDGAEFVVELVAPDGLKRVLLQRLLRPTTEAADRGWQTFRIDLPPGTSRSLVLRINPGPAGNPASDWTFWTDLALENSL